jgi:quercetin dioxygenase-like cupin family protein
VKVQSLSLALLAVPFVLLAGQDAPPGAATPTQSQTPAPAPATSTHVVLQAAELKWGDPPPAFERGAQAVVLSGDPHKPGLFAIRIKMPAGYKVANHWHPTDEHVTLLEGDLTIRMNDGAETRTLSRDAYMLLPTRMHHAVSTANGATVQVSAVGPFELTYVDPKDDPRKRTP